MTSSANDYTHWFCGQVIQGVSHQLFFCTDYVLTCSSLQWFFQIETLYTCRKPPKRQSSWQLQLVKARYLNLLRRSSSRSKNAYFRGLSCNMLPSAFLRKSWLSKLFFLFLLEIQMMRPIIQLYCIYVASPSLYGKGNKLDLQLNR